MHVLLYTSSFCGACDSARAAIDRALELVPAATVSERNVAFDPAAAEAANITATPTVVFENAEGAEVFRAQGVPTVDNVLAGLALSV
jgi:thiol-disulfide isomerase/thioredoxin